MEPAPPPQDRRIPGWKIVLVLVVIGIIVLVPALFLRFPSRFGPTLLLLRVTDAIRASPDNATVSANLGPHCSPIVWNPTTRSLTATSEVSFANVVGLLLQKFDRRSENILSDGGDLIRATLAMNGAAWTLRSPVDGRILSTFLLSGENVTVGASTYGSGDSWPLSFAYNVTTPGGAFQIEENLTLTNEGFARPRIVLPDPCV